ncbi:MAG TPA: ABC transporter permease, partial [Bryobacteraceae bacterium]|nr:ABC transporter permease [Bryobacteraceae bacterium]
VRLGPGFDVDERELDSRLSAESQQAIRAERARDNNIASFYFRYLAGLVHGDLGFSRSLNRPVLELLKERLPLTLASLGYGVLGGASLGLALALLTVWWRAPGVDVVPAILSGLCLAAPAAVVALVVFPHVYRYAKNQLVATSQSPHVVAAQAKGLSAWRVLWAHVFTPAAPQLAALAGISVSLAFGASIPIEVICDTPGVGQLAWRAALDRDLPLLVTITVLVAVMTLLVNSVADLALAAWRSPSESAVA